MFFCIVLSSHKHTLKTYIFYYAICLSTPHVYCDMANMSKYLLYQRILEYFLNMVTSWDMLGNIWSTSSEHVKEYSFEYFM
jgi:hypothetical protein